MRCPLRDIFCLPCQNKYLIYAPRHNWVALVNRSAAQEIRFGLESRTTPAGELGELLEELRLEEKCSPAVRQGIVDDPLFLGLIPTRACNLECGYCDFDAQHALGPVMTCGMARDAIDAYLRLLRRAKKDLLEIHFFGGEPLMAWDVVFFAVHYARLRAKENSMSVRFEVITNGMVSPSRAYWLADRFDTVVLSLDGPEDIQSRQRAGIDGANPMKLIFQNAKILANGSCDLALRACVTRDSVGRMAEIASWMLTEFYPSGICFETMTASPRSQLSGFEPPDPYEFVQGFLAAQQIIEKAGVDCILSTAMTSACQTSFCPVGKDAMIVSPDGQIYACYWMEEEWLKRGLDLRMGSVKGQLLDLDPLAVQRARDLTIRYKQPCETCFCKYHCAGGCHVRRASSPTARREVEVCIQTRLITAARLLHRLNNQGLLDNMLLDQPSLEKLAYQQDDRLVQPGSPL